MDLSAYFTALLNKMCTTIMSSNFASLKNLLHRQKNDIDRISGMISRAISAVDSIESLVSQERGKVSCVSFEKQRVENEVLLAKTDAWLCRSELFV